MPTRRLLIALALSLFIAACGATPPPDDALTDPAEFYDAMIGRLEGIEAIRIRAVLEYYGEDGRVRIRQAVVARKPADLRIETLSPFDTSLALLVTNANSLAFYDMEAERFYTGEPTPDNIARLIPLWMTPSDIVRVLLGGPPLDATESDPSTYTLDWDRREGAYRLTMPVVYGGRLELLVQHGTWTVSGATQYEPDGTELYELRTGRFEDVTGPNGEAAMPMTLRFLMAREQIDISLDIESVELDPTLNDLFFELLPPRGVEQIEL